MTDRTFHLIDGTALLFRSYFSPRPKMLAPDGTPVTGVMGLTQILARYVVEHQVTHAAVVFDAGQKTFRNRIDPAYKANRGDPPEDLVPQFDLARIATRALGFLDLAILDYEADDLIATLCERLRPHPRRLVSIDKDLIQLLEPGVRIVDDRSGEQLDAAGAYDKHGVRPELWTTFQALCGDSVDNVRGAPGVGAKTAAALIEAFGSLDDIYDRIDEIEALPIRGARTLGDKLRPHRDTVQTALRLVTLDQHVPMTVEPEALAYRGPQADADAVFDRLGFHQPLRKLRNYHTHRQM